jgi:hypothetical protein
MVAAVRELIFDAHKLKSLGEAARAAAPDYARVKELQKFIRTIEEARYA